MTKQRSVGTATRLISVLVAILSVVFAVTGFATVRIFTNRALTQSLEDLSVTVRDFQQSYGEAPVASVVPVATRYLQRRVLPKDVVLLVRFSDGHRLATAGARPFLQDQVIRRQLLSPPATSAQSAISIGGQNFQYVISPLPSADGKTASVIAIKSLQAIEDSRRTLTLLVTGQALVALLASVLAGYLLLRRLLLQVGDMTETAQAISDGAINERIGDPGTGDEMAALANTLDSMLDRLSSALDAQRRLLSDVSHQLRTPLTVARGQLEVLDRIGVKDEVEVRATIATVLNELDHMRSLTERLLILGRSLEPDFLDLGPVEVLSLCDEVFAASQVLAPRSWLYVPPLPHLIIEADYAKVRGALLNLLENAVKATKEGDVIELTATAAMASNMVHLAVGDSGPGIAEQDRAVLTERFARAGDADVEGSGLGLAIVTAVAEAHGGELELGESRHGGLKAVMSLPLLEISLDHDSDDGKVIPE